MICFIGRHLFGQVLGLGTLLPGSGKLSRGSWNAVFKPFPHHSLVGVRNGGEEVWCCCAVGTKVAKVGKVAGSILNTSKVDLPPFVEKGHFVEALSIR